MSEKYRIRAVAPDSVMAEMGVEPSDYLLAIDGQPVECDLDVDFLAADEVATATVEKHDTGEVWELEVDKAADEDFGIVTHDEQAIRRCTNNCIFCFIDQMPPNMRETLYVKDDDERMSFLYGNYVTLTNLSQAEKERIARYHIMPINISVHTTDSKLRQKMLHNRFADTIMDDLRFFKEHGITMNAQIVLCPGYNDGDALARTLADLTTFYPQMRSVSVVPFGMTKFRQGLAPVEPVDAAKARETMTIIGASQKKMLDAHGVHFVYPSDELFLLSKTPIPDADYYEDFTQLENGVGMLALFESEVRQALETLPDAVADIPQQKIGIITAHLAKPMLAKACAQIHAHIPQISFEIFDIDNHFFGESITVAGLVTGQDILAQVKNICDGFFVPENMVKFGTHLFLDDVTTDDLAERWQKPVTIISVDGTAFVEAVLGNDRVAQEHKLSGTYEPSNNSEREQWP